MLESTGNRSNRGRSAGHARAGFNHAGVDFEEQPDLRRKMATRLTECVYDAAPFLSEQDRELALGITVRGQKASSFAATFGKSPRQIRLHARRLLRRIVSSECRFSIRLLANKSSIAGTATRRNIARECFVHGVSIRDAAKKLGLTIHTVRSHVAAIRNQAELMSIKTGERLAG